MTRENDVEAELAAKVADPNPENLRQVTTLVWLYNVPPERGAELLDACPRDRRGRYLVFGYEMYYPLGGLNDVHFDTDNVDDAKYVAGVLQNDTVEVYDRIEDEWIET